MRGDRLNCNCMNRKGWLLCFSLLLFLTGCQRSGALKGPPSASTPEQIKLAEIQPDTLTIADLKLTPGEYHGRLLHLNGRFESRPIAACGSKVLSWPAWQMADGEAIVPASGPANLLSALQGAGSELIAEGFWRYRPVRVGCDGTSQDLPLWYFDVVRIVSPNPLALRSPAGASQSNRDTLTTDSGEPDFFADTATFEAVRPTIEATGSPVSKETEISGIPKPGGLDQGTPYPGNTTPAATIPQPILASPSPSDSGFDEVATVTPTGTVTNRATGSPQSRASLTPTIPGQDVILRPLLEPGSLETGALQANQSHLWPYEVDSVQTITVQVSPDAGLELTVSVETTIGEVLATATQLSVGAPLILSEVDLPEAGRYEILIRATGTSGGNYAILVTDEESYSFIFQGLLKEGISASADFEANNDHFWAFSAQSGDSLRLELIPDGNEDLFFRLFDPQGTNIISSYNELPAGEKEELLNYLLLETGLYSLLVGEQNFGPAHYSVIYFIE